MCIAFVQIWAASIGRGGAVVMTVIAVLGLILSTSCAVTASSRLIFAIARDGILPGSRWIAKPSPQGQPRNAVTVILVVSTLLLIISIGSQVAFTSLLSAGATSMSTGQVARLTRPSLYQRVLVDLLVPPAGHSEGVQEQQMEPWAVGSIVLHHWIPVQPVPPGREYGSSPSM
jgi:hypothetical protein